MASYGSRELVSPFNARPACSCHLSTLSYQLLDGIERAGVPFHIVILTASRESAAGEIVPWTSRQLRRPTSRCLRGTRSTRDAPPQLLPRVQTPGRKLFPESAEPSERRSSLRAGVNGCSIQREVSGCASPRSCFL